MAIIKDKDREFLKKEFEKLDKEVQLMVFTQEIECEYCELTRNMAEELAALSSKISVEVKDLVKDKELAEKYGVDKIPALLLWRKDDSDAGSGVRFFGVPAGYEFTTLVEDILDVSRGETDLPKDIRSGLGEVKKPVHMQVFVSPTCPYCPQAVRTAHKFAMESEHVTADMVEVSEFPHLAVKYEVQGVPRTVINEETVVMGAQPEGEFLSKVKESVSD